MDEYIPVLNDQGQRTGERVLKSEAHRHGIFHPTVHVWCYLKDGALLFQKRAFTKKTFPGLWDVSVAGHISFEETEITAAQREVEEELGLIISEERLQILGTHKTMVQHSEHLLDHELHHVYLLKLLPAEKDTIRIQQEEVDAITFISIATLEEQLHANTLGTDFVPMEKSYYLWVTGAVKKLL